MTLTTTGGTVVRCAYCDVVIDDPKILAQLEADTRAWNDWYDHGPDNVCVQLFPPACAECERCVSATTRV